jgi:hypothetical protein
MPEFSKPGDLKGRGLWKELYDRLLNSPLCRTCNKAARDAEALAIVNALYDVRIDGPLRRGCIRSSQLLMTALTLGIPGGVFTSGQAPASSVWNRKTWMTLVTPCFSFRLVAWWWGPFRHQSVLAEARCASPGDRRYQTVLESLYTLNRAWYTYPDWAGGEGEIGVSTGFVEDGF